MPIKNYYTVDGELIGESTVEGGHRSYGLDALGSVVATYDGTGALENTYRNAPYGTQVQKTGTAADPRFLWNGGSGYRTTLQDHAPYYVRARVYDNATGRWTNVDPLWPRQPAYAYADSSPLFRADPRGKSTKGCCINVGIVELSASGWVLDLRNNRYVETITLSMGFSNANYKPNQDSYSQIYFYEYLKETGDLVTPPNIEKPGWNTDPTSYLANIRALYLVLQTGLCKLIPRLAGTVFVFQIDHPTNPIFVGQGGGTQGANGTSCVCQLAYITNGCPGAATTATDFFYIRLRDGAIVNDPQGQADCKATCANAGSPPGLGT